MLNLFQYDVKSKENPEISSGRRDHYILSHVIP